MRYARLLTLVASTLAIIIAAHSARAQYSTYTMPSGMGGMFNNSISATIAANQWNRIFLCTTSPVKTSFCGGTSETGTGSSQARSASASQQARSRPAVNDSVLRFHSSGTYLKTRELADQLGNTPEERAQYLKLMNAVLDEFRKKVTAADLQNDVAIALSYFFVENLRIYRGLPEASDQQYVDVRNVIAKILLGQSGVTKLTDRQKQEYYEALVAYTGITQFGYEQAKQAGNEQIAKGYQQVAGQNLQTLTKMSPDSLGNASPGGFAFVISPVAAAAHISN